MFQKFQNTKPNNMLYKLNQIIYFVKDNDKDTSHFNWLFRAISLVSKKYIEYTVYNGRKKEKQFHKERVFAYELYRQWANILESECNEPLVLNAELDKIIDERIGTDDDIENVCNIEEERKYPDIVLHNGQGSDKKQKIICEIKRNTETKISGSVILADLYKLACYMDEEKFHSGNKPFEYGVFVFVNGSLNQIKTIKRAKIKVSSNDYSFCQFKQEMSKHFENIICVTYDGATIEYKTLKGLL